MCFGDAFEMKIEAMFPGVMLPKHVLWQVGIGNALT
jgi:hypothetical protein